MFDLIKEHMLVVVSGLLSIGLFGLFMDYLAYLYLFISKILSFLL